VLTTNGLGANFLLDLDLILALGLMTVEELESTLKRDVAELDLTDALRASSEGVNEVAIGCCVTDTVMVAGGAGKADEGDDIYVEW
jgi:hypothetical protein